MSEEDVKELAKSTYGPIDEDHREQIEKIKAALRKFGLEVWKCHKDKNGDSSVWSKMPFCYNFHIIYADRKRLDKPFYSVSTEKLSFPGFDTPEEAIEDFIEYIQEEGEKKVEQGTSMVIWSKSFDLSEGDNEG